jgi:hypothetical protein
MPRDLDSLLTRNWTDVNRREFVMKMFFMPLGQEEK